MAEWRGFWGLLAGLWVLAWLGWTLDIYEADDVFVTPFLEIALAIPIGLLLLWWLVSRMFCWLGRCLGKGRSSRPKER